MKTVIIKSEPGLWTIGHYSPRGDWNPIEDFGDLEEAKTECARIILGET